MRIVTAAVMASTLAVSSLSHAAEVGSGDNWHPGEELTQRSTQSHMFDGISLTEHQRQQMRDLMQQARHEQPPVNVSELRQCIALSPQKILMKTLCAHRQKKWRMSKLLVRLRWQKSATKCIAC